MNLFAGRVIASHIQEENYPPLDARFLSLDYGEAWDRKKVIQAWTRTLRLIQDRRTPSSLGLYLHWPYCPHRCSFCFCDAQVPKTSASPEAYAKRLESQFTALAPVFKGIPFDSLVLGGGTPTFAPPDTLERLLGLIELSFSFSPGGQRYIEAVPSTLTPRMIGLLSRHGFNRLTLGVQSLDPAVLNISGRPQTRRMIEEAVARVRRDLPGVLSLDLIAGIEGQTVKSFLSDVVWAVGMDPDMLHLYRFDPRPGTEFSSAGKTLGAEHLRRTRLWITGTDAWLRAKGFRQPEAVPPRAVQKTLEVWQDVSARWWNGSLLGFGANSLSHAFGSAWYCQAPLRSWSGALKVRAVPFNLDEEMRAFAIFWLDAKRSFSRAVFAERFGTDPLRTALRGPLSQLEALGKLEISSERVTSLLKDPGERLSHLKLLYSPKVTRMVLKSLASASGAVEPWGWAEHKYLQHRYYNTRSKVFTECAKTSG